MTKIHLSCLGHPSLEADGRPLKLETRKALALLVYLRMANPRMGRESLAALFWPEYDPYHAHANLRRVLSSLRKSIPIDLLEGDHGKVELLKPDDIQLDIEAFRCLASSSPEDLEQLEAAAALYQGDFLDGFNLADSPDFDEWQSIERENLRQEMDRVLNRLVKGFCKQQDWEKALGYARRRVGLDRLSEEALRQIMEVYAHSGQPAAALRQHEEFVRFLEAELGQQPEKTTQSLYQEIREGRFTRMEPSLPKTKGQGEEILLKTKVHLPPPRSDRVVRPRLLQALGQVGQKSLTLISAPAGFGKTTLAVEWAATQQLRVGWFSLDSGDNAPYPFLTYLLAALETVQPGITREARTVLKTIQPFDAAAVMAALLNRLEQSCEPFALVLEDYHLITNPAVHELGSTLLERMPPCLHLVILTRVDPPLQLARLRTEGKLLELRASKLRFTEPEATALLNERMGLGLSAGDIHSLVERTEGWGVGLQMAGISLIDHPDPGEFIRAFSGSHRYILDYLAEEVLGRQPEAVQNFLMQTSILERLTASLCNTLTGETNGQAMLELLEKNNLFIISLDDEREWFRYHHLFADLLRARLEGSQPGAAARLQTRASEWYESRGMPVEAVQCAYAAGDEKRVTRLLEENMARIALNLQVYSLARWINLLPEETIYANPWFCIMVACDLVVRGRKENAPALMDRAEAHFHSWPHDEQYRERLGIVASLRANIADLDNDLDETIRQSKLTIELLGDRHPLMCGSVNYLLARTYQKKGDFELARRVLEAQVQHDLERGVYYHVATCLSLRGIMDKLDGCLRQAEAIFRRGVSLIEQHGYHRFFGSGVIYQGLADILREQNHLEAAEEMARTGLGQARQGDNLNIVLQGLTFLGRIFLSRKDLEAVNRILEECDKVCTEFIPSIDPSCILHALRVRFLLMRGDIESAAWRDTLFQEKIAGGSTTWTEVAHVATTRVLIAEGKTAEAVDILQKETLRIEVDGRIGRLIEALNLLAIALDAQGKRQEALLALQKSLRCAGEEGYVRTYLDEGSPMLALLEALERTAPGTAQRLLLLRESFL